jgi:hypothetical protein
VWQEADDTLRAAIRAAWDANRIATGGHEWRLPSWISAYPEIETNPQKGIPFPPFRWDEDRRAVLRAELDAYYARLYGLTRKQLRYILDPADLTANANWKTYSTRGKRWQTRSTRLATLPALLLAPSPAKPFAC